MLRMMDVAAMPTSLCEGSSQGPPACSLRLSALLSAPLLQQRLPSPTARPVPAIAALTIPRTLLPIFPLGLWLSCLFPSQPQVPEASVPSALCPTQSSGTSGLYLQSHANGLLFVQQPPQIPVPISEFQCIQGTQLPHPSCSFSLELWVLQSIYQAPYQATFLGSRGCAISISKSHLGPRPGCRGKGAGWTDKWVATGMNKWVGGWTSGWAMRWLDGGDI